MFSAVCSSVSSGRVSLLAHGGEGFAVDVASSRCQQAPLDPGAEWPKDIDPEQARRAVMEYLAMLAAPAYGAGK